MNAKIKRLTEMVDNANSIAVLTGAGISTSSGIPDFRSAGGLYADERNINVFDLDAFNREPKLYYNFAREFYPRVRQAQPNTAHHKLAEWLKRNKKVTIITQNIDDYHQRAGSVPVHTVHGTFITSTCTTCNQVIQTEELSHAIERGELPCCACGGIYKPDITFFGEMLPEQEWSASVEAISESDLLLVIGTSLTVYPAASLPSYRAPRTPLVIINRDPTPLDREAAIVIHQDICEVMEAL
ncbi:MAG: NAD-dependent deacylase [Kiritimatiellia bacterium]